MHAKITAKTIGKMKPGDDIGDTEIRGFSARCWDSGKITYSIRYRTRNGRKRLLIGTHGNITADEARKIAKQRAGEIAGGIDPQAEKGVAGTTVSAVWDSYADRVLLKSKRTAEHQMRCFDRLVRPAIGDRPIYDLKRSDMVRLLDTIADTNGRVMADRMMAYLGKCFRWQQVRDDDFISPIIAGMARTTEKELRRNRVLSDDEIRRLWKTTEQGVFGSLIRFLLLTGARRSEASEMTCSELHGSVWVLPAARNKVKVDFVRPLSGEALAIVKAFPRGNGYVFAIDGKPLTGFSCRKRDLDKATGIKDWRIHDLRRTARSLMSRAGVTQEHAEIAIGHTQPTIVETYDQYEYDTEKKEAFEKLATLVRQIVTR